MSTTTTTYSVQGTFPVKTLVRGTTLKSRTATVTLNGVPASFASVEWEIKRSSGQSLLRLPCSVASGQFTMPAISSDITFTWPEEVLVFDFSMVLTDGTTNNWVRGGLNVVNTLQSTLGPS